MVLSVEQIRSKLGGTLEFSKSLVRASEQPQHEPQAIVRQRQFRIEAYGLLIRSRRGIQIVLTLRDGAEQVMGLRRGGILRERGFQPGAGARQVVRGEQCPGPGKRLADRGL